MARGGACSDDLLAGAVTRHPPAGLRHAVEHVGGPRSAPGCRRRPRSGGAVAGTVDLALGGQAARGRRTERSVGPRDVVAPRAPRAWPVGRRRIEGCAGRRCVGRLVVAAARAAARRRPAKTSTSTTASSQGNHGPVDRDAPAVPACRCEPVEVGAATSSAYSGKRGRRRRDVRARRCRCARRRTGERSAAACERRSAVSVRQPSSGSLPTPPAGVPQLVQ